MGKARRDKAKKEAISEWVSLSLVRAHYHKVALTSARGADQCLHTSRLHADVAEICLLVLFSYCHEI